MLIERSNKKHQPYQKIGSFPFYFTYINGWKLYYMHLLYCFKFDHSCSLRFPPKANNFFFQKRRSITNLSKNEISRD